MRHITHQMGSSPFDAGKPPATFDEEGTGNVAWLRYSGTRRRKSEQQRTQTSTYTGAPVLDPTYERPVVQSAGLLTRDIVVFKYPPDPTVAYVKRIITIGRSTV